MKNSRRTAKGSPFFQRFPVYAWICLVVMFSVQMISFSGTRLFLPDLPAHDLTTALDRAIPLRPAWVAVYFFAFATWLVGAILILSESKTHGYRFAGAYILAMLFCAAVFLIYPCTMDRPEVTGTGFFVRWLRFIYAVDTPTNLFPSLHVLINYYCWRGTFGCRRIPGWFKWFSFVYFILVCCSVLLVKQHVLADIPSGIIAGEVCLQAARALRLERIFSAAERILKGRGKEEQ